MPRPAGVRSAPALGLTGGHQLRSVNPPLADMLEDAVRNHVVPTTRSSYASAVRQFCRFVKAHGGGDAFPVQEVWVCAWALFMALGVSAASLKAYLSALKYEQGARGHPWRLDGSEMVRRVLRYVAKSYGGPRRSIKFPVTVEVLRKVFPHLAGWPSLRSMSHDDRVFAAASAVAVFGFLRGGEFLWSRGSSRPLLMVENVATKHVGGVEVVEREAYRPA